METDDPPTEYFSSYEDLEIHKLMLEDEPRTSAYRKAIMNNKRFFKDKVVMDVGCGTGILSIFCAQAGAKKVYAIEASKTAELAMEIVKENKFEDVIEVIHCKVEDLELPGNTKVDAIVSEWMGFYLLHEGMLDSVLLARDKFLKDGGEMFPESATIYVSPCSVPSLYRKWDNFHGVSMVTFAKQLRICKYNKPEIMNVQAEDLMGCDEVALGWVNLKEDTVSNLDSYSIQHVVGANKDGSYQGMCIWFECVFPDLENDSENYNPVRLDTGPLSPPTHWKQTVIILPEEQEVETGDPIAFELKMTRDAVTTRRYNLQLSLLDAEVIEHPLPCTCDLTKCLLIKTYMLQHPELPSKTAMETNGIEDEAIDDDDIDDENDDG
ncbi:protein arginine N-methyltransferase 1 [Ostrinia furnacalis]|uniref:protein arginine N-methyltransferase 1 n=1 Tax=Ostrinia furnacalis TaxID=93504 RepID=UPI00103F2A68|nr:protein arginine N-methyltransferase 1 [Ostrinia furnacalis]